MSKLSDPRSFRRTLAGLGMTVAPVLLVATELVHPEAKSDAAGYLAVAVDNAGRWYLAHALALVALAAAVPAVLGLMHLLRPRGPQDGATPVPSWRFSVSYRSRRSWAQSSSSGR